MSAVWPSDGRNDIGFVSILATAVIFRSHGTGYDAWIVVMNAFDGRLRATYHAVMDDFGNLVEVRP